MSINQTIKKESLWLISSSVFLKFLQFATIIILSWILKPDDFGLFGLSYAVAEVLTRVGDFGIGTFLIYKKDLNKEIIATAIWSNLFLGFFLMFLTIGIAPFIAVYFDHVLIESILYALSLHLFFTIVGNIHLSLLQKKMAFKRIAIISTSVLITGSLLTIILAASGFGVWSFVIPTVSNSFFLCVFFWINTKALPQTKISLNTFKEIFNYSKFVWIGDVNSIALHNIGLLMIGKLLTIEILGYFKFALSLVMALVILFQEANSRIFMPLFSHLRENKQILEGVVVKLFQYLTIVSIPLFLILIITADKLIIALFGEKWQPSISAFQVFCVFGIIAVVSRIIPSLLNAIGRPELRTYYSASFIPVLIVFILVFAPYETVGVSAAYSLSNSLFAIVLFAHTMKIASISLRMILKKIIFLIAPGAVMVGIVYVMQKLMGFIQMNHLVECVIIGIVGVLVFIASFRLFDKTTFNELLSPLKDLNL